MSLRRRLIQIVTFLGGIYFFLEWLLPEDLNGFKFGAYHEQITNGFVAVGAMAIGLGLFNLLSVHGSVLIFKRRGWINSAALLVSLLLMTLVTALDWRATAGNSERSGKLFELRDFATKIEADFKAQRSGVPQWTQRNLALKNALQAELERLDEELRTLDFSAIGTASAAYGLILSDQTELQKKLPEARALMRELPLEETATPDFGVNARVAGITGELAVLYGDLLNRAYEFSAIKLVYRLLYDGLFVALGSAMFSLLGFYIASAAYRAFRLKSFESGLMLGAALLVMLGQIPFGLWIWSGLPDVRLWILEVPNSGAFRAIKFGAALAGLVLAFRMWLSIESESFSSQEQP
ncbi:MAG: hypothetical protein K1X83_10335 [Oligoflexia bacterium]|nr:hypothetical protein [Oligoflexia bacterium]